MEVFGAGAKLKPDVDLSEYVSHGIQIILGSEECGKELKNVLGKDES